MIQVVNAVLYGALGIAAVVRWRRRRTVPSAWLAATFATLALVVVQGLVIPAVDPADQPVAQFGIRGIYTDLLVIALLGTPWLLFRFARSLHPSRTAADVAADVGMALVVLATIAAPAFPADNADAPRWFGMYYLGALIWWSVMLGSVAWSLWRAGRGQPGVVRRRMQLMALAALSINAALLAPALSGDADSTSPVVEMVTAALAWGGAIGFSLGVEPPPQLRRMWRVEDELALRAADVELVRAESAEAAAAAVVQAAARLVGGSGARIVNSEGAPLATYGDVGDEDALRVQGQATAVIVSVSPYTPVFGADEETLLRQLCAHLDLAVRRIQAYEASVRARVQTEQVNTELQQLVYGISHDLRNPLITVLGFLDILAADTDQLSDDGRLAVARIGASAVYMDALIQDLLQLSRIGRTDADPVEVHLGELVAEIAADVEARHDGVDVEVATDAHVWMNPVRARQLFTNLVENAARHGGRRPLRVTVRSAPPRGGHVTVEVADDGVGIPTDDREQVFQIFKRLSGFDADAPGSGIGLTMCRRIVDDIGGSIAVADAAVGTTMRLDLPAVPQTDSVDAPPSHRSITA